MTVCNVCTVSFSVSTMFYSNESAVTNTRSSTVKVSTQHTPTKSVSFIGWEHTQRGRERRGETTHCQEEHGPSDGQANRVHTIQYTTWYTVLLYPSTVTASRFSPLHITSPSRHTVEHGIPAHRPPRSFQLAHGFHASHCLRPLRR